jgi:hypothetical protein
VPYGTGLFVNAFPGSELPGYDHLVPPGRNPGTCLHFWLHITLAIEDQDADEYSLSDEAYVFLRQPRLVVR